MKRTDLLAAAVTAALSFCVLGCASQSKGYLRLVQDERWTEAVAKTEQSPRPAAALAVAIIEDRAAAGHATASLVTILAGAGREGRSALARLEDNADETVADLAFVAAHRRSAPPKKIVRRLVSHTSSDVRAAAAAAWNDELEPDLAALLLLDIDPRVRLAGVSAVAESDGVASAKAAELLSDRLRRDPSPQVRAAAARRGDALGPGALSQLLRAAEDESLGVQLAAMSGLAALNSHNAVDVLRDAATAPFDEKTVTAAAELAGLGIALGAERMREALEHEARAVRLAALLRLERAGLDHIEETLIAKLDDEAADVAVQAASMLARRTDAPERIAKAQAALRRIYKESGAHAARARDLLATLGDPEALEAVRKVLEAADEDRAIATLRRVRGVEALRPAFLQKIPSASPDIRLEAAIALVSSRRY